MKKGNIRRSVTIPLTLDKKISLMADDYSFKVKNDLIIELLELGILKFNEDNELKIMLFNLSNKIDSLIKKMADE